MLRPLCLLAVLLPRLALASCIQVLSVWPSTDHPLPANGQVVIEGNGSLRGAVAHVAEFSPRLVAGDDAVALRVSAVHWGKEVTQAVLVPERPLRPGKRYALSFEPPTDGRGRALPTTRWVDDEYVPWAWTVTEADVAPPRWHEVPRTVGGRYEQFGCGPAIEVNVSALVDDEGPELHVLAEVRPVERDGVPVRFRLTPWREQVAIGHGMCGGGFQLEEDVRYSVRLIAVDMAGNEVVAPGGPLIIQGPRP